MLGATNLQRTLRLLVERHGVTLAQPRRVPLTPPPDHDTLILEGIASSGAIDIDRVRFAPFCFGTNLPTVPLLIEHDRPAGQQVTPTYDSAGGLRVRTAPLSGDARRYAAFSVGCRNIQYDIHAPETRNFHFEVTAAELTEISLTEYPHLPTALVLSRTRPAPSAEFFALMVRRVDVLTRLTGLMSTIQKEARG